ncbi:MAG TPA: hypothetical protein VJ417_14960, partial [Candidatus Glassbacteria bacterium]|nr:hypothetical protein [Candidatus Glassbacteria bacterium]
MERTNVAVVSVIVLGLCIAFESGVSAGNEQAVVISPADRTGTTLVIYNNDLAFISETRSFERRAGIFRLEFSDVGRTIVPASVSVRPGSGLQVLEQQYDFDLISRHRLLASYIGRRIELERLDQRTQTRERLSGTLLSLDG